MNVQCSLIWEHVLYEVKLENNAMEMTKMTCAKSECAVEHSAVTRWVEKFCLGCKNLNSQTRSGRPKTMDSKAMLKDRGKFGKWHLESIRRAWHLIFQCSSSHLHQLKHLDLLDCFSCYQNIAKLLTHLSNNMIAL